MEKITYWETCKMAQICSSHRVSIWRLDRAGQTNTSTSNWNCNCPDVNSSISSTGSARSPRRTALFLQQNVAVYSQHQRECIHLARLLRYVTVSGIVQLIVIVIVPRFIPLKDSIFAAWKQFSARTKSIFSSHWHLTASVFNLHIFRALFHSYKAN